MRLLNNASYLTRNCACCFFRFLFDMSSMDSLNLNSPRTKEALARQGLLASELQPRTLKSFQDSKLPASVAKVRFEHYEERRQHKLKDVWKEREKIVRRSKRSDGHAAERYYTSVV